MDDAGKYIQQNWAWLIAAVLALSVPSILLAINLTITKRRAQKALSWRVLTDTPLVTRQDEGTGKIEILYEGQPVKSVRLVQVTLSNSGGKEIEAKDFAEPVQIRFPDNSTVFEPQVVTASPEGFLPQIEQHDASIILKPTLMNPGDRLTIKCLVATDRSLDIRVSARISGVQQPTKHESRKPISSAIRAASVISLVSFLVFSVLYSNLRNANYEKDIAIREKHELQDRYSQQYSDFQKTIAALMEIEKLSNNSRPASMDEAINKLTSIRDKSRIAKTFIHPGHGAYAMSGYHESPLTSAIIVLTCFCLIMFAVRSFSYKDTNEDKNR